MFLCCTGYLPCSGKCGESRCPEFCFCAEVFLCFGNSVASNRFLLQDEFNIQTTQCQTACVFGSLHPTGIYGLSATSCLGLFHCCNDHRKSGDPKKVPRYYPVCLTLYTGQPVHACMQTQHKIEMDKRDGEFGAPPVMAVPPVHQMSRIDQPIPRPAGYASHHLSQLTGNHMAILLLHTLHLVTRMLTHLVLTLHLVLLLLDIPSKMHRSKSQSFKCRFCHCCSGSFHWLP